MRLSRNTFKLDCIEKKHCYRFDVSSAFGTLPEEVRNCRKQCTNYSLSVLKKVDD